MYRWIVIELVPNTSSPRLGGPGHAPWAPPLGGGSRCAQHLVSEPGPFPPPPTTPCRPSPPIPLLDRPTQGGHSPPGEAAPLHPRFFTAGGVNGAGGGAPVADKGGLAPGGATLHVPGGSATGRPRNGRFQGRCQGCTTPFWVVVRQRQCAAARFNGGGAARRAAPSGHPSSWHGGGEPP